MEPGVLDARGIGRQRVRVTQAFVRHKVNEGFFQKLLDVHGENNVGLAQASAVFVPQLQLKSQLFLGAMALLGAFEGAGFTLAWLAAHTEIWGTW